MTALAWGTNQRLAMWATMESPSKIPRNGPMCGGILDLAPSSAMT